MYVIKLQLLASTHHLLTGLCFETADSQFSGFLSAQNQSFSCCKQHFVRLLISLQTVIWQYSLRSPHGETWYVPEMALHLCA